MITTTTNANGKASTRRTTFSRETSVSIIIHAAPAIPWALLTKAADVPRWNSTITSIEGSIAPGETIRLRSTLDAKRVFKLKVKEFLPGKKLAWGDAMGLRVFLLTDNGDGSVTFSMTEKIGGPLFPLFAKMIPPFNQAFEQFAADLKKEAELIMQSN